MTNETIYHIVTQDEWDLQKNNTSYVHPSLAQEGFIHSSTAEQLAATIKRYYANQEKVIVLHIDVTKLEPELIYELAPSVNEYFPHIFGAINLSAVVKVEVVIV
jgi:uncharacterized protein (DUF952 family)